MDILLVFCFFFFFLLLPWEGVSSGDSWIYVVGFLEFPSVTLFSQGNNSKKYKIKPKK